MSNWNQMAPTTEKLWEDLPHDELAIIDEIDAIRLQEERREASQGATVLPQDPYYSARNHFRFWELMISKMGDDWPPDNVYYIDEYVNDLETRDGIETIINSTRFPLRDKLRALADTLDSRFRVLTVFDNGDALGSWARPTATYRRGQGWWWTRRPIRIPWENT